MNRHRMMHSILMLISLSLGCEIPVMNSLNESSHDDFDLAVFTPETMTSPTETDDSDLAVCTWFVTPPTGIQDQQIAVVRDPVLRWLSPVAVSQVSVIVDDRYTVATTSDAIDTCGLAHQISLEEPLPPWTPIVVNLAEQSILAFTTGDDFAGDQPRVMEQKPSQELVTQRQTFQFHFSQQMLTAEIIPTLECDEPVIVRWLWQQGGAVGILEPVPTWPEGNCQATIQDLSSQHGIAAETITLSFQSQVNEGRMRIAEVVTDPQQDWSDDENTGFDLPPGDGTVSTSDEYIVVVNGSNETVDLTGWRLEMLDGSDEVFWFDDPHDALYISPPESDLLAIPPCGVVTLGNPPGSINNEITLRLIDDDDQVVDRLQITDIESLNGYSSVFYSPDGGAADSTEDESIYASWVTGDQSPYQKGVATPGQFSCP